MQYLKAFGAGYIATLLCHQGVLAALHAGNPEVPAPFNMTPTEPFGVPAVVSLAFWGGIWGIALWVMIRNSANAAYWVLALVIGAVGPSAVALFIVFPLKGLGVAMDWNPQVIIGALVLNAAWGLGVAVLMKLFPQSATKAE